MALVTVQRTPSPRRTQQLQEEEEEVDAATDKSGHPRKSRRSQRNLKKLVNTVNTIRFVNRLRFSESYFTIKGAALILPKSDKLPHTSRKRAKAKASTQVSDIQIHLQCMFHELRPNDTIQVAIKLESATDCLRYLAIVVTEGADDKQEGVIIGFHCTDQTAEIGMVLPVYNNMEISLDGDGGFRVLTNERPHIFKPISVQAMWSALMSLKKVCKSAQNDSQISGGPTHTWLSHYVDKMTADQTKINEWEIMDDLMSKRDDSPGLSGDKDESDSIERQIRSHLRELMVGFDLDEITSLMLRLELEKILGRSLKPYRWFIDQEMILIIRQLDAPSEIFDFVFLGSEWNASNLGELQANSIGYILNVTREIDNFFPGLFKYMNIRLYDDEVSDLMRYWENTHRFICKARDNNSRILVHCKMGVSRSASTVIAFAMKEYGWSLDKAMEEVRSKRSVIRPNDSFMQQLQTYEGILNASKQRWNPKFKCEAGGLLTGDRTHSAMADEARADDVINEEMGVDNSNNPQSAAHTQCSDGGQAHNLDKEYLAFNPDNGSDFNESNTDSSDSETCSTGSTVSYHLEDDEQSANQMAGGDDSGQVIGLQYSKLDIDNMLSDDRVQSQASSLPQLTDNGGSRTDAKIAKEIISSPSTSNKDSVELATGRESAVQQIPSDATLLHEVKSEPTQPDVKSYSSGMADDVSVCQGLVHKTKEQIAEGLQRKPSPISRVEERELPVTPGTVRKVLGQIRCKSQDESSLSRSASFRIDRGTGHDEEEPLHRSSSVRARKSKPSNTANPDAAAAAAADNMPTEYLDAFAKIWQKKQPVEEKVKFSIGGDQAASNSSSEDLERFASISASDVDNPGFLKKCGCSRKPNGSSKPISGCTQMDCMLRISSKPSMLTSTNEEGNAADSPSPVPVRALVGAFEDIGSAVQTMTRPLTIHVDSFSSDAFAHNQLVDRPLSPLQRSQSLRTMIPGGQSTAPSTSNMFDIRNVTTPAQSVLQPYWKIKRDTKKLMHSYSSAAMESSKDVM